MLAVHGLAILSQLQARPGTVRVVVDGMAASIASVIMQAASPGELVIAPGAVCMVHEAWVEIAAGAAELRKQADVLELMNSVIAGVYADRSRRPVSHWLEAMAAETWYSAADACDAALADRIGGRAAAPSGDDLVPVAARAVRHGVLAAAGDGPQGHDRWGHPVSPAFKRAAFAMYEAKKREHEARTRAPRNGRLAAAGTGHSAFAKAVYGVD